MKQETIKSPLKRSISSTGGKTSKVVLDGIHEVDPRQEVKGNTGSSLGAECASGVISEGLDKGVAGNQIHIGAHQPRPVNDPDSLFLSYKQHPQTVKA